MKNISSVFLRFGLGIVFLLFGIGKFMNDVWAVTIRNISFYKFLGGSDLVIYLIGALEVIIALALIFNFKVKLFSGIASLELISILIMLNFGEIRDIGLLGASLALFFMTQKRDVEKDLKRELIPMKQRR